MDGIYLCVRPKWRRKIISFGINQKNRCKDVTIFHDKQVDFGAWK